jgi:signal transduction histidine kinase
LAVTAGRVRESLIRALLGVPVSIKVMGIVLGVVVLMGAGMLWSIHQTWHDVLRRELQDRARSLAADLARSSASDVAAGRVAELERRLLDAEELNEELDYVLVLDPRGAVVAHTGSAPPSFAVLEEYAAVAGSARVTVVETPHGKIHVAVAPVPGGQGGTIHVGMGELRVAREVRWLTRQLATVTIAIAAIGLGAAWLLTRILARPVHELVATVQSVREGRLDVAVPVHARDEIGTLATAFNEMVAALSEKERQKQNLLRKVMGVAEAERKRLARELHDETGQALTSVIAELGALEARDTAGTVRERLAAIRLLAERTLRDVQDVSRALRPSVLDDLGLETALQRHCESLSDRLGVPVDMQSIGWDAQSRLSAEMEIALYRIVQESLTNAVRHARARSVHVLLHRMPSRVLVVVEDDGLGFDSRDWRGTSRDRGHLGLLGIEERANLLAGTLRVESAPGSGTSIFVELPLLGTA